MSLQHLLPHLENIWQQILIYKCRADVSPILVATLIICLAANENNRKYTNDSFSFGTVRYGDTKYETKTQFHCVYFIHIRGRTNIYSNSIPNTKIGCKYKYRLQIFGKGSCWWHRALPHTSALAWQKARSQKPNTLKSGKIQCKSSTIS